MAELSKDQLKAYLKIDVVPYIKEELKIRYPEGGFEVVGDYYTYRPMSKRLNKWMVSDGAVLDASLYSLFLDYAFRDPVWEFDCDPEWILEGKIRIAEGR